MSVIEYEKKPVTFIRQVLSPLSAQVTTTATVITVSNEEGVMFVAIPAAYMTANCATGANATVTITTGTGSTVIIPLCPKGDTLVSGALFTNVYIDSSGNVSGENFVVKGSNTNGTWEKSGANTLLCLSPQMSIANTGTISNSLGTTSGTSNYGNGSWTFPAAFYAAPRAGVMESSKYINRVAVGATLTTTGCLIQWVENESGTGTVAAWAMGPWHA